MKVVNVGLYSGKVSHIVLQLTDEEVEKFLNDFENGPDIWVYVTQSVDGARFIIDRSDINVIMIADVKPEPTIVTPQPQQVLDGHGRPVV